jgi:RimJ/RimL family protein N-acetyltransferase
VPDHELRRHCAALRAEWPLHFLVPEMSEITVTPTLETKRLILRPLAMSDAPAIQRHFNNWNIIQHLAQVVPWPYPEDGAVTFITRELERVASGEEIYNWMLVLRGGDGEAIGNIRFRPRSDNVKGNRGFWLAERYWNQGLMSEAVSAVNDFAFRTLGIESFYACNAVTNVASRRVKQKTGAEFLGYVELAHHDGQTLAEKWRVTRENWLRRNR